MTDPATALAFGPVPSRRLKQSLGVNNIPPKTCTYSCVYCQVGRTTKMPLDRSEFVRPSQIARAAREKCRAAGAGGEAVDYITFVPDVEPTLELHLGEEIDLLTQLGVPMAVITNASLMDRADVRAELARANWVSVKIDSVSERVWRAIDRPHPALRLGSILEGILEFSQAYDGMLVTETMIVDGVNDSHTELEKVAEFIAEVNPTTSYLSVPKRPPAEKWVQPAGERALAVAHRVFSERGINTEYLIGYEGNAFASTGDVEADLLSITAVHPMREDAVDELLQKCGSGRAVLQSLVDEGRLVPVSYSGNAYYVRALASRHDRQ